MDENEFIGLIKDNWGLLSSSINRINENVFEINDEYILKVYKDKSVLEKIIAIYSQLNNKGVRARVPIIISTINGCDHISINKIYIVIMSKVDFDNSYRLIKVNAVAELLGGAIGHLHNELAKVDIDYFKEYEYLDQFGDAVSQFYHKAEQDFDRNYIIHSKELKKIVHGDVHLNNFLFLNGKITSYIDFDSASINYPSYDLIYAYIMLLQRYKVRSVEKASCLYNRLVKGYSSLYDMKRIDIQLHKPLFRYIVAKLYEYYSIKEWIVAKKRMRWIASFSDSIKLYNLIEDN